MTDLARILWIALLGVLMQPGAAVAQSGTSQAVTIVELITGWHVDSVTIKVTGSAMLNPAGCPTADGYSMDATEPGYKTHYAALLTAMVSGKKVFVIVSNTACAQTRPAIIGLHVQA